MTFEEIRSSPVGIWFESSTDSIIVIIKIPTYLIKHISLGVDTDLITAVYEKSDDVYPMIGLRVFDNINHPALITERVEVEQLNHFKNVFQSKEIEVRIYDELGFHSLSGHIRMNKESQEVLQNYYGDFNKYNRDKNIAKATESLDCFALAIEEGGPTDSINKIDYFKFEIYDVDEIENIYIGSNEISKILPLSSIEGDQLEHQIAIASESIFKGQTFRGPQVKKGDKSRELIDVLMIYDHGMFLIETKAMSVFNTGNQSFARKSKNIAKQIKKAIDQLIGANKQLKKGNYLFDANQNEIKYNPEMITENIVLVSEMVRFEESEKLKQHLLTSMVENNIFIQLIGFDEYMLIVKVAEGSKEHFDHYLMKRKSIWIEKGCPLNFKLRFIRE